MSARRRRRLSLAGVGLFYAAMAGAAVLGSMLVFGDGPLVLRENRVPLTWSAPVGIGVGLALVGASRWSSGRFRWARRLDENFRRLLGQVRPVDAAVMAVSSGVAEELLFRGFLLRLFLPRAVTPELGDAALGVALASLAFGVLHIGPDRSYLPWTIFATLVGAVLGGLTVWSGDVTAAILAHLTVNYFNFLAIGRER